MKAGWEVKPIATIADHSLGKMLDKNKNKGTPRPYLRNLNVRWFGFDLEDVLEMKFETHEIERYSLRMGDVAVCEGGYPGRAAIWEKDEPVCIQKALHRVRFHEPERAKWFVYFLSKCDADGSLKAHFSGAGIQHLTGQALAKLEIPLPPLEEQQRIVAVLDEAFEGLARARAHAEANLQNAREMFDAKLTAIFSSPPTIWQPASLGSKCLRITVGHVGPMAKRYSPSGIPFLRSQNVRPFHIDLTDVKHIDAEFMSELGKSELRPGDVVIVRTGYPGTAAVIPDNLPIANCADLVIARTGPDLSPNFLAMLLNSSFGKAHVAHVSVGAAQQHFNVGAAKKSVFPLPPLRVQEQLVEESAEFRALTASLQRNYLAKLSDLDKLRQSLLQKAFSGEFT